MKILIIKNEEIDEIWEYVEDYLAQAASYSNGKFLIEDVKANIIHRNQTLWVAYDDEQDKIMGATVTEVCQYPRIRALMIQFIGGIQLETWKSPQLEAFQIYARNAGCQIIEAFGRSGWEKICRDDGFKQDCIMFTLPVIPHIKEELK
jgi:hypothetical protein